MTYRPPSYWPVPGAPPAYEARDSRTWDISGIATPSFVAGAELADLAERHSDIVVLTADLAYSNGTHEFEARHPDRFFNVGIAEQNMVSVAAGMATCGKRPYVATFASFVGLLASEQIRTDVAYPRQCVHVLAHHAGMSLGFYGTSHHALEDIAFMRSVAELHVVSATDASMLRAILRWSVGAERATYIRIGRGRDKVVYDDVPEFHPGASYRLRDGHDLAIVATGSMVAPSLDAARFLAANGVECRVIDMVSIDPLDASAVLAAAAECGALLTVEEHNVTGGLGTAVAEVLADHGVSIPFRRHGVHDEYVLVGPPAGLYAHYRLDGPGIAEVAQSFVSARAAVQ